MYLRYDALRRTHIASVGFLPQMYNLNLVMKKQQTKIWGHSVVVFKTVKVVIESKTEERSQIGEIKETQQPDAMWGST